MSKSLSQKRILITGAGGSLGAAAALEFASAGWHVYAADMRAVEWHNDDITPIVMDVTDEASIALAAERIGKDGELSLILHMAGLYTMDSFIEIEPDTLRDMLNVNLLGVYHVNRAFFPLLSKTDGRIIITASELAALDPLPFNGIYSMTKRALDAYAHSLALELHLIGTKVITLYPGAYGDGMTKGSLSSMERMRSRTRLFADITDRFRSVMLSEIGSSKPPSDLAKRIRAIAEKPKPRFRYFMNCSPKLKMFSALPMRLQAFALRKLLVGKRPNRNP